MKVCIVERTDRHTTSHTTWEVVCLPFDVVEDSDLATVEKTCTGDTSVQRIWSADVPSASSAELSMHFFAEQHTHAISSVTIHDDVIEFLKMRCPDCIAGTCDILLPSRDAILIANGLH